MRIEIEIPDKDIPQRQDTIDVYLSFIDGKACECNYPFTVNGEDEKPKADAFDEIRAKIIEEKELAYADFERYKVEYLGQDWEDAYDSLPNDDFRYGMERTIEIIDKYRQEG